MRGVHIYIESKKINSEPRAEPTYDSFFFGRMLKENEIVVRCKWNTFVKKIYQNAKKETNKDTERAREGEGEENISHRNTYVFCINMNLFYVKYFP